jgi:hypothetical protein
MLDTRPGNVPRWFLTLQKDYTMRVPDEMRRCVVFVGIERSRKGGQHERVLGGTAFFVAVPSERFPDTYYEYIVTAKHVVAAIGEKPFFLRINTPNGGSTDIQSGTEFRWWFHPTDAQRVDVAVMRWTLPEDAFDYASIPTCMFLTEDIIQAGNPYGKADPIGTGDEMFFIGLFTHVQRLKRNLPIVRIGNIAMMPAEPIPFGDQAIEAYLIEARSIGGLSGSPAFVRETVISGIGGFYLLGLMQGHWDLPAEYKNYLPFAEDVTGQSASVNMGIAVVVPVKKILEVLYQSALVEQRTKQDEKSHKTDQSGAILDVNLDSEKDK